MWPQPEETQELLRLAEGGDSQAVNQLMDRHRDSLRQLVRMRLDQRIRQRVDVSDIVQDVLIEANRRLADYLSKPGMSFRLWLRQIAKDRIIDAHRRHRGSARRSVDRELGFAAVGQDQSSVQLVALLNDQQATPAEQALQKELALKIEAAILQLEERDSEVVVMRHYEQLTNQEVATTLNISEPAASMRYLRALRKLKQFLQGDDSALNSTNS